MLGLEQSEGYGMFGIQSTVLGFGYWLKYLSHTKSISRFTYPMLDTEGCNGQTPDTWDTFLLI